MWSDGWGGELLPEGVEGGLLRVEEHWAAGLDERLDGCECGRRRRRGVWVVALGGEELVQCGCCHGMISYCGLERGSRCTQALGVRFTVDSIFVWPVVAKSLACAMAPVAAFDAAGGCKSPCSRP